MIGRTFARFASASLAALLLTSCFSVQTHRRPLNEGDHTTGGIALRVYADDAARKANTPGPRGLSIELDRKEGAKFRPVFRSLEPTWSVLGLPPGEYRLSFPERLDAAGEVQALDERPRMLRIHAGEVAEVDTVLSHVNKGMVVAGVVAAVVAAVLLDDWLGDHDLRPPLPHLPPPPPDVLDAIFWISVSAGSEPYETHEWHDSPEPLRPLITSHFPPADALVAAQKVRITFSLSGPIDGRTVSADAIRVVGENSGVLPGRCHYDADRWWIVWEGTGELPRDESFRVDLAGPAVAELRSDEPESALRFDFRSAP
ncbi:MAG: hypothetical protein ABI639_15550 [Thermoanaerobaculia bacterium]